MATLADIRAKAKELIVDTGAISDAKIDAWIQDAQEEAEDRHGFLAMEAEQSYTTASGGGSHTLGTLPTDWARRRTDPYWYDGAGKTRDMAWIQDDEELRKRYNPLDPLEKGSPGHLREDETNLYIYPLADGNAPTGSIYSDGEYRVLVPYWKRLTTLDDDGDSNWFSTDRKMLAYLEWYAASEGMFYNRNQANGIAARTFAEGRIKRAIRSDKRARLARDIRMGVHPGPHAVRAR